jgi:hypothetical protein
MKYLVLALPFFALPAAVWADDEPRLPTRMSLDDETRERQDPENERQRPDESTHLTPMEFFYRHSYLEAGVLYTDFDSGLSLKSHMAYYIRYGVEIAPRVSVHLTYRYNNFGNGGADPATVEDVTVQSFLIGASYHQPLTREFALVGSLSVGTTWWDSTLVRGDISFTVSGEFAATARLWELLHFKAGLVVDGSNTSFHSASGTQINLSWLFGFEYGM